MAPITVGTQLFALFYDLEHDRYEPRSMGRVSAVRGDRYLSAGRWWGGYPMFGSEADARAWIAENPRTTPTIR